MGHVSAHCLSCGRTAPVAGAMACPAAAAGSASLRDPRPPARRDAGRPAVALLAAAAGRGPGLLRQPRRGRHAAAAPASALPATSGSRTKGATRPARARIGRWRSRSRPPSRRAARPRSWYRPARPGCRVPPVRPGGVRSTVLMVAAATPAAPPAAGLAQDVRVAAQIDPVDPGDPTLARTKKPSTPGQCNPNGMEWNGMELFIYSINQFFQF